MRWRALIAMGAVLTTLGLAACGGGGGGNSSTAPAPADPEAPVSGTLRTFTYEDTIAPNLLGPFKKENPGLDVKTATFDSDSEAAAKLVGGFQADVVEACADEINPLTRRHLLRPLETEGDPRLGQAHLQRRPRRRTTGKVLLVPLSAGPQGLIVNTEKITDPPDSWKALFDPQYAGEVAIEGDTSCWRSPRRRWRWEGRPDEPQGDELDGSRTT